MTAAVAQRDRLTFPLQRGSRKIVNEVELFAEVVQRETYNIEKVSMDILYQHAPQRLDSIATSLVPDTHRQRDVTYTAHVDGVCWLALETADQIHLHTISELSRIFIASVDTCQTDKQANTAGTKSGIKVQKAAGS